MSILRSTLGEATPVDSRIERYRFCPYCGGPLDPSVPSPHPTGHLVCGACGGMVYLDPKVAACVITDIDGKILLLRQNYGRHRDSWMLPGGFVDKGEQVELAALRELREEAGVNAALDKLVGVFSYPHWPVVVIIYSARLEGVTPVPGEETAELRLFAPDAIPWNLLAFPSTRDALRAYLDGRTCQPRPLSVCMPADFSPDQPVQG